jgi:methylenetetrahydrofolate reductase (NADPH)
MRLQDLEPASRPMLVELVRSPTFEVLPLASTLALTEHLPSGATVSVAISPNRGLDATLEVAEGLAAAGFRAVPHVAARIVRDRAHLRAMLDRLAAAGINRAFVVGGDATDAGPYPSGLSLLREMSEVGSHVTEIGIPGYPEGHPFISGEELQATLVAKAPFASYITTQLCFDARAIANWIVQLRADGIDRPLHIGVAGAVDVPRLLRICARIGVTTAARFALRQRGLVTRLLNPRGYVPDSLLEDLVANLPDAEAGIETTHIYTFNQLAETERWRQSYLAKLSPADRAAV